MLSKRTPPGTHASIRVAPTAVGTSPTRTFRGAPSGAVLRLHSLIFSAMRPPNSAPGPTPGAACTATRNVKGYSHRSRGFLAVLARVFTSDFGRGHTFATEPLASRSGFASTSRCRGSRATSHRTEPPALTSCSTSADSWSTEGGMRQHVDNLTCSLPGREKTGGADERSPRPAILLWPARMKMTSGFSASVMVSQFLAQARRAVSWISVEA